MTRHLWCLGLILAVGCGGGTTMNPRRDQEVQPPPAVGCPDDPELMDTSRPDRVVGDGTPASCTEEELRAAMAQGGVVTFDCGSAPHEITVSSPLEVFVDFGAPIDTVLDGGGNITLSGGGRTRILEMTSSFERAAPLLHVQRLTFRDGRSGDGGGEDTDRGGGAIWRVGGRLTILDSTFLDNRGPERGQDIAGGAVYAVGGAETVIARSTFQGNACASGGAVGSLLAPLTLINVTMDDNAATGINGNPGNGGNGGAVYLDGGDEATVLCGVRMTNNRANAAGGGLFRVSNDNSGRFRMERSVVENNRIPDGNDPSQAGGLYLQGLAVTIADSTVAANEAAFAGGIFYGPRCSGEVRNTTIAENVALSSLGGGVVFSDNVSGLFLNVTIARNRAPGEVAFAGGTVGFGVTFRNVLIADNEAGNGFNPISCLDRLDEGGGNVQWPVIRSGGDSDDPGSRCTEDVLVADPMLGPLSDLGGPTRTMLPGDGSPAIGIGNNCPATDQRGQPRPTSDCTAGAVEP